MRHHFKAHHGRHGHHRPDGDIGERPGRRRRLFESGEFRLVLLKLIEEQSRHSYDLIRELEARSGGAYAPSPGVVYPTTAMLLDMGLVEEAGGESGRKVFAITEAGRAELAGHEAELSAAFARLQAVADVRGRTDAAPVARAMGNLKTALHNRLSQEGVDKTVILDVADLIDEAARKIERL